MSGTKAFGVAMAGSLVIGVIAAVAMEDTRWTLLVPGIVAVIAAVAAILWTIFHLLRVAGAVIAVRLVGGRMEWPPGLPWHGRLRSFPLARVDHPRRAFPVTMAIHLGALASPALIALGGLMATVAYKGGTAMYGLPTTIFFGLSLAFLLPYRSEGQASPTQTVLDWWKMPERSRAAAFGLVDSADELGDRPRDRSELALRFAAGMQNPAYRCVALTQLAERATDREEFGRAVTLYERALRDAAGEYFVPTRIALALARTEAGINDPAEDVIGLRPDALDPFTAWRLELLRALRGEGLIETAECAFDTMRQAYSCREFPLESHRLARLVEITPFDSEEAEGPGDIEDDDQASA